MRFARSVLVLTALVTLSACSDSDPGVQSSGQVQQDTKPPIIAEVGSGDRAYSLQSTSDLVSVADQVGLVTVTKFERDPEVIEVHNDELLQNRLVRATVVTPIEETTPGQMLTFVDGTYSRTRPSPDVSYGEEQLFILTEGIELTIGDQAIIGLRDGELMTDAVLLVSDGSIEETSRSGPLFDETEGRPVSDAVNSLAEAATAIG